MGKVLNKVSAQPKICRLLFWLFTLAHYLIGMAGLYFATLTAISSSDEERKHNGLVTVVLIMLFALTQTDLRFKKTDTGWQVFDNFFSGGKSRYTSSTRH